MGKLSYTMKYSYVSQIIMIRTWLVGRYVKQKYFIPGNVLLFFPSEWPILYLNSWSQLTQMKQFWKKKETLRNHESKSMEYDVIFLVKWRKVESIRFKD